MSKRRGSRFSERRASSSLAAPPLPPEEEMERDDAGYNQRKRRRMKAYCFDFSQHTTSHGIYWIGDAQSKRRRFFWVIAFLLCLLIFLAQAFMMVARFLRYDTIVNIELKFETAVFPAVTVCNLNPFKYSLVQGVESIRKTLDSYTNAMGKTPGGKTHDRHPADALNIKTLSRVRRQKNPFAEFDNPSPTPPPEFLPSSALELFRFKAVRVQCGCPPDARSECVPRVPAAVSADPDASSSSPDDVLFSALRKRRRRARLRRQMPTATPVPSTCVCFYDTERAVVWPCYAESAWRPTHCAHCAFSGTCLSPPRPTRVDVSYAAKDATLINYLTAYTTPVGDKGTPCYCQNVSNVCVAHPERRPPYELYEAVRTTSTPPPTTTTESEAAADFEKAQGFENMTDEVAITTRAKENLVFTTANLPVDLQEELSYQKHELLRMCSFNGRQCDIENDFKIHPDPVYGSCYTFNHLMNSTLTTTRAGPFYGTKFKFSRKQ